MSVFAFIILIVLPFLEVANWIALMFGKEMDQEQKPRVHLWLQDIMLAVILDAVLMLAHRNVAYAGLAIMCSVAGLLAAVYLFERIPSLQKQRGLRAVAVVAAIGIFAIFAEIGGFPLVLGIAASVWWIVRSFLLLSRRFKRASTENWENWFTRHSPFQKFAVALPILLYMSSFVACSRMGLHSDKEFGYEFYSRGAECIILCVGDFSNADFFDTTFAILWLANPMFWIAVESYLRGRHLLAVLSGLLAAAVALLTLMNGLIGLSFYLWASSMVFFAAFVTGELMVNGIRRMSASLPAQD